MKTITLHVHPLALAAIVALGIPAVAVTAGTILAPPVTVTGAGSGALFSATNNGIGAAIISTSLKGKAIVARGQSTGVYAVTTNPSLTTHTDASGVGGYDSSTDQGTRNNGVYGQSKYGSGVKGSSADGFGTVETSNFGVGVSGSSTYTNGVVGQTSQPYGSPTYSASGVMGVDATGALNFYNSGVSGTSSWDRGARHINPGQRRRWSDKQLISKQYELTRRVRSHRRIDE